MTWWNSSLCILSRQRDNQPNNNHNNNNEDSIASDYYCAQQQHNFVYQPPSPSPSSQNLTTSFSMSNLLAFLTKEYPISDTGSMTSNGSPRSIRSRLALPNRKKRCLLHALLEDGTPCRPVGVVYEPSESEFTGEMAALARRVHQLEVMMSTRAASPPPVGTVVEGDRDCVIGGRCDDLADMYLVNAELKQMLREVQKRERAFTLLATQVPGGVDYYLAR